MPGNLIVNIICCCNLPCHVFRRTQEVQLDCHALGRILLLRGLFTNVFIDDLYLRMLGQLCA